MTTKDIILIHSLEFYGFHGVSEAEQKVGNRYLVNVELGIDTSQAGVTDSLDDTVDYALVVNSVLEIGERERFKLLEALAHRIANHILEAHSNVSRIKLRIEKLLPPIPANVAAVGVEITRFQNSPHSS